MSGFVRVLEMEAEEREARAEAKAKARRIMLDTVARRPMLDTASGTAFGEVRDTVSAALADAILARLDAAGLVIVERGRA